MPPEFGVSSVMARFRTRRDAEGAVECQNLGAVVVTMRLLHPGNASALTFPSTVMLCGPVTLTLVMFAPRPEIWTVVVPFTKFVN